MAASAATVSYCPSGASNICFAVGVPQSTASSGSGNIYFSITAPTSYQWVALGTGTQMSGSNIFLIYQDGTGNLTLSPRLGTNHVMPTLDTQSNAAQLTLLAGSGVSGSTMTANIMCANCESWGSSSSMSVTNTKSPWISAWKSGKSLATTNKNAAISQHDSTTQYTLDLSQAVISTDSNPFVSTDTSSSSGSSSGSGSGSDSGSGSGSDSGSSSGSSSGSDSGSDSGSSSGSSSTGNTGGSSTVTVTSSGSSTPSILIAHATIMSLVMVLLYPLGAALMPLVGNWLAHGVWQGVAYLLMWAGFAVGVVVARQRNLLFVGSARNHTVIGTVVVAAMGIQPLLGFLHHRHFVRNQSRGLVSHVHIWWGRLLIILGIINGGLGLKLADAPRSAKIGYSVAAVVLFLAYVGAKVVGSCFLAGRREKKRDRGPQYRGNGSRAKPALEARATAD